jgi:hypothetical protein
LPSTGRPETRSLWVSFADALLPQRVRKRDAARGHGFKEREEQRAAGRHRREEAVEIELTQEKVALIDAEEWDRFRQLRWYAAKTSRWYAHATPPGGNSKSLKLKLDRVVLPPPVGRDVDHVGYSLDNRRAMLRPCDDVRNQQNTTGRGGSSRFKGVSWFARRGRWRVVYNWDRKTHFVGYFDDEEEAAHAYDAAVLPLAGEFARLNFP